PLGRMEIGGDIILSINDMPIGQMSDLIDYLEFNTQPGDLVTLVVLRDGTTMNVQVTLEARP
ncbi:MAG: PDZ domain-containing protein, partial [Chloroflexi bacterium]|nr:PDZ domain-containing protein [Chloroflexota bacterium]